MSKGVVLGLVMLKTMYRQGICSQFIVVPIYYTHFRSLCISLFFIKIQMVFDLDSFIFLFTVRIERNLIC